MKLIRDQLDKIEPFFLKGGPLERLYPMFEAADTLLYTPGEVTKSTSHVRDSLDMKRMMASVVVALVPCIFMALYNTGYQANLAISEGAIAKADSILGLGIVTRHQIMEAVAGAVGWETPYSPTNPLSCLLHGALWFVPVYGVTMIVGGHIELLFSIVRKHEVNEGFLVTGMLFPLTLPPAIPLWQVALGIAFGVVIGKEIFGGTGKNFLNPALTARAFLYFAHASFMSGSSVWVAADGYTSATVLTGMADAPVKTAAGDAAAVGVTGATHGLSMWDCFIGFIPGSMGETSALACLIGAGILIMTGIGSWRIMSGVVLGTLAMGYTLWAFRGASDNPVCYINPLEHLIIGGFAFGTVFMATDPVSAAMTQLGQWWYGILIGVMTILIRVINPAFAEGIMLAILFGNVMAPLIDYFVIQANVQRRMARYAA